MLHNRCTVELPSNSHFVRSPTQGTTFLTNLREVHKDIVLGGKFTDLRVAYAAQKSAETKIQCVFIEHSDAATKAGAMGPTASSLQQKMNTTRQGHALKNILLHDATCVGSHLAGHKYSPLLQNQNLHITMFAKGYHCSLQCTRLIHPTH